ncbi:hypothetical protein PGTUg99_000275 [Puccinia graminis f. sp. tritici]|uniref:Uncharacterized protein n=1 Tax=Puccinia graminis f. sp. tritici TaxID=56615 RepID=A0A5B0MMB8_PUCGR|nr:hypothetical protein PGTUg99_000275 [Puccinia graminis f. sp. tritici]
MTPPGKCSNEPVQHSLDAMPESRSDKPMQGLVRQAGSTARRLRFRTGWTKTICAAAVGSSDLLPSSSSSSLATDIAWRKNGSNTPSHPELANDLDPTRLSQLSLSPTYRTPPAIFVAVECPESVASWQIPPDLFGLMSHSEDGLSESTILVKLARASHDACDFPYSPPLFNGVVS